MEFDNLDALRVLLATAETGSLTAAGKRCNLSTAAVSAAIKRLEKSLGVRLFERTTRVVRPTAEGAIMVDHARRALELVAEGQARVRAGTAGLTGGIRITMTAILARGMLASWVAEFAALHPGIEIDLQISDARVDLVREGIDVALRTGPLADSTHSARLLAPARRVACASPDYLARCGQPGEPQELATRECLVCHVRERRQDQWQFEQAGDAGAPFQVRVNGPLSCNDASIALHWALEGRGIVYLSEVDLIGPLADGRLVRLFPGDLGEPSPLYAVVPSRRYVPARVDEVIAGLAAWLTQRLALLRSAAG